MIRKLRPVTSMDWPQVAAELEREVGKFLKRAERCEREGERDSAHRNLAIAEIAQVLMRALKAGVSHE